MLMDLNKAYDSQIVWMGFKVAEIQSTLYSFREKLFLEQIEPALVGNIK